MQNINQYLIILISKMKKLLLLVLFILIVLAKQELRFDFGQGAEGIQLFKYFNDIEKGFYVDIGAFNPVTYSNTLNLHTKGWYGVNVEANPNFFKQFLQMRKDDINVGIAIGEENQFVTFYQSSSGAYSTISKEVKQDFQKEFSFNVTEYKVPAYGMADLCKKYYQERPLFLSLDIQGYGYKAFTTNDWDDKLCRPHIIFSEYNKYHTAAGLSLTETLFKEKNYTLIDKIVGFNQIFIDNQFVQFYEQKKKANQKLIPSVIKFIDTKVLEDNLKNALKVKNVFQNQYNPQTADTYLHFAVIGKIILPQQLQKQSAKLAPKNPNRPILILELDPFRTSFAIESRDYYIKTIKLNDNYNQIFELTINPLGGESYSVYILNQGNIKSDKLSIIINDFTKRQINPSNQNIEYKQCFKQIAQLKEQNEQINKQLSEQKIANNISTRNQQNIQAKLKKQNEKIEKQLQQQKRTNNKNKQNNKDQQKQPSRKIVKQNLIIVLSVLIVALILIIAKLIFNNLKGNRSRSQNRNQNRNNGHSQIQEDGTQSDIAA